MKTKKMNKLEKFIERGKNKFGNRYDYNEVIYISADNKVKIKCNLHNEIFLQKPVEHIRGRVGCNLCTKNPKVDTEFFIKKSKLIHDDRYDYSKTIYTDSATKLIIICREHGEFEQLPNNHYKQNCPKCQLLIKNKEKILTNIEFINEANLKHLNKYDYSLVNYINSQTKVKIICPEHGEFEQLPASHLYGKGCKLCAINKTKKDITCSLEDFIKKCNTKHGTKYDYSLANYINSQTKIKIICPEHGEFEQLPYDHISGHGCLDCGKKYDKSELAIIEFIKSLNINIKHNDRKILNGKELDIFIPEYNLAIEYNGLYWHSEEYLNKDYHLNKTNECEANSIQLIHIFEDEWLYKRDIIKSRLKNIFGLTENKIYGRKCVIKEVTSKDSKDFLDNNHIQGNINTTINIGLYYNNKLVSLMTFNKPRLGIGTNFNGYELSRFCNKLDTTVIGGADKLLKYFIKTYNPKEIISYADRRWSQGNLYEKIGFTKKNINKPNYSYIIGLNRKHRFGYRKEILKKDGFDTKNKTEHEIMLERKIYRIYDCGTITYNLKVCN